MDVFLQALAKVFSPAVFINMLLGVPAGICIGALPGLTATMGVALLLPLTFGMETTQGILMLLGIYCGAIYGGSITAVLLHTPGTPASAATVLDGYAMAKKGEAGRALGIVTLSSYIGGLVSVACLILISPQLAKLALKFSSAEYFLLAVFGLCIIGNISGKSIEKGLICGCIGVLVASIGVDSVTGYMRFSTFNGKAILNFLGGISYIPVMIGLFAMSQAFEGIEEIFQRDKVEAKITRVLPSRQDMKTIFRVAPITGLVGTFIGIIPGAGADIGAFVGYDVARSMSKHPEEFGKGSPEAISGPEGGNNGVTGGALIPMLTLGVPGDAVTAILIGALTVKGLNPGPMLFTNHKVLVYSIFIGMFLANTIMFLMGMSGIKLFSKVLKVPKAILTPVIFILCVIGSYAMNNNLFDVGVMLVFGIVGYFFTKVKIPTSPAILGLILGPMAKKNFRTALLKSGGNLDVFFNTVICWVFIALILFSLFGTQLKALLKKAFSKKMK
ncbi:MAG: tripartite tricarboxylate transporter permease [Sphaerochaetaceae bacterium]|nr:tripartite tricarboxylate transporter permease [Sphaerochaetaceae bacterium]